MGHDFRKIRKNFIFWKKKKKGNTWLSKGYNKEDVMARKLIIKKKNGNNHEIITKTDNKRLKIEGAIKILKRKNKTKRNCEIPQWWKNVHDKKRLFRIYGDPVMQLF